MKVSFALFVLTTGPLLLATGTAAAKLAAEQRERERELTPTRKKRMKYSSKSSKSNRKSTVCKFEKHSKDFEHVLEEYEQFLDKTVFGSGIPDILDPPVDNFVTIYDEEIFACAEDAAVFCARQCDNSLREGLEFEEECTTFELFFEGVNFVCYLYNNNNNVFNQQRMASGPLSPGKKGIVYNNKVRAPQSIQEGTRTEGLFPPNLASPSPDLVQYGFPAVSCVAAYSGITDPLNNIPAALEVFQPCQDCLEGLTRAEMTCIGAVAGACGVPNLSEDYYTIFINTGEITSLEKYINTTFFSDEGGSEAGSYCGLPCKAGASSDYVCRSTMQTFYLAVLNQGEWPSYGCTTTNIRNPVNGDPFPDYTCPPNTDQLVYRRSRTSVYTLLQLASFTRPDRNSTRTYT